MHAYLTQQSLVSSLARYVQVDDLKLPRELFLRKVLDRIVNDLIAVPRTSQGPGLAAQQCEREGAFRRATFRGVLSPFRSLCHPLVGRVAAMAAECGMVSTFASRGARSMLIPMKAVVTSSLHLRAPCRHTQVGVLLRYIRRSRL
jgi:hypothetical protein